MHQSKNLGQSRRNSGRDDDKNLAATYFSGWIWLVGFNLSFIEFVQDFIRNKCSISKRKKGGEGRREKSQERRERGKGKREGRKGEGIKIVSLFKSFPEISLSMNSSSSFHVEKLCSRNNICTHIIIDFNFFVAFKKDLSKCRIRNHLMK